jgi:hypothetical protein
MDAAAWVALGGIAVVVIATAFGFLLARKDAQQGEFIKDLYDKHKEDSEKLIKLELELARSYHPKNEVQDLFRNFKTYLDEKFTELKHSLECTSECNTKRNKD